ncbi:MAG: sigma-54-dependent Fis family transcriptional regulator [Bacillaceae bacterium]|nr:sigma-54-dependent Fis family transcriptional regulator [Bacillaceae bacterium]
MKKRVLIVDDEEAIRFSLESGLTDEGFEVRTLASGLELERHLKEWNPHLVILDVRLPELSGYELLEQIKIYDPGIQVMMMTAFGDTQGAVKAMKMGAADFIDKPFDFEDMLKTIHHVIKTDQMKKEWQFYRERHKEALIQNRIIGESRAITDVIEQIKRVAPREDTTVLITGETGTGKEVAAKTIHNLSPRSDKPFMDINCAAIPANLIESELFGHEKNAFTGAGQGKKGLFELADGGTIFLDEIGEMPYETQAKLLRFIETRKFRRIGSSQNVYVDVRIIAATNRDLSEEVEQGRFRSDLYYRLNVFPIQIPPLRERKEDIPLLIRHFWPDMALTDEVLSTLENYSWPGNVRELKNILERLSILYPDGDISVDALPSDLHDDRRAKVSSNHPLDTSMKSEAEAAPDGDLSDIEAVGLEEKLNQIEKRYIEFALHETRWNISKAAKKLGMKRHVLQRRVQKHFPE